MEPPLRSWGGLARFAAPRELERAKWDGGRKPGGRRERTDPLRLLLSSVERRKKWGQVRVSISWMLSRHKVISRIVQLA